MGAAQVGSLHGIITRGTSIASFNQIILDRVPSGEKREKPRKIPVERVPRAEKGGVPGIRAKLLHGGVFFLVFDF